ncbi:MAG: DUF2156 domain-containing protein [Bacilli bacterium]|nr:DUF2156 domain-containing protein [Bacilli bacterium]
MMIKLEPITLTDKQLYDTFIKDSQYPTNCWSGNFTYIWAHNFSKSLKIYKTFINGFLVTFIITNKGRMYLPTLPFGAGNLEELIECLRIASLACLEQNKKAGITNKAVINPLNEAQLNYLKQSPLFTTYFQDSKLTGLERHYSINKLLRLKGKEFQQIRNKLNRFKEKYPQAIIRKYTDKDFHQVSELNQIWIKESGKKYKRIIDGFYFEPIIKNYANLNHHIIVIEIDQKIVGLISGEVLPNKNAWGCLTKFDKNYDGISETLTIEFVKHLHQSYPYINTINVGSDLGDKGLAFNKERYRPVYSYKRYCLYYKQ